MSLNGDIVVMRNGRSTSQVSVYNYPEHLNPFYDDDQHKRLRFWKINKSKNNEGRRNSFSISNLRDIWTFKSFNMKKKSSTLGINKTSESPPVLRREFGTEYNNQFLRADEPRARYTLSAQGSPSLSDNFARNKPYRSSLQNIKNSEQGVSKGFGFNRNDQYRSTTQFSGSNSINSGRPFIRSSQVSLASTNPFESDDDDCMDCNKTENHASVRVTPLHRKKRRAPQPPTRVIQTELSENWTCPQNESLKIEENSDILNLTAEIENFVKNSNEASNDTELDQSYRVKTPQQIKISSQPDVKSTTQDDVVILEKNNQKDSNISHEITQKFETIVVDESKKKQENVIEKPSIGPKPKDLNALKIDEKPIREEEPIPKIRIKRIDPIKEQLKNGLKNDGNDLKEIKSETIEIVTDRKSILKNGNERKSILKNVNEAQTKPVEKITKTTTTTTTTTTEIKTSPRKEQAQYNSIKDYGELSSLEPNHEVGKIEVIHINVSDTSGSDDPITDKPLNVSSFQKPQSNNSNIVNKNTYFTLSEPPPPYVKGDHLKQNSNVLDQITNSKSERKSSFDSIKTTEPVVAIPTEPLRITETEETSSSHKTSVELRNNFVENNLTISEPSTSTSSTNCPVVTKRKSVKDIIESINRSQRLLNESAAKGTYVYSTALYNQNNNGYNNTNILSSSTTQENGTINNTNFETVEESRSPLNSPKHTDSTKPNNENNFKKDKINKVVCQYRESSPTSSNLDWNPLPKPKRTKNLSDNQTSDE